MEVKKYCSVVIYVVVAVVNRVTGIMIFILADTFNIWQRVHTGCGTETGCSARGREGTLSRREGNR
jgi:hypothetical protein